MIIYFIRSQKTNQNINILTQKKSLFFSKSKKLIYKFPIKLYNTAIYDNMDLTELLVPGIYKYKQ